MVSKLLRALKEAGISAASVRSDALPQVWTELGWFFTEAPGPEHLAWVNMTRDRWEAVGTAEEAIMHCTLWQIEDGKRSIPKERAKYLRRIK